MGGRALSPLVAAAVGLAVALVVAVAAAGPPAGRAATITSRDVPLAASGSVVYSWTANPALGCAAEGLCGTTGATTVTIENGDLLTGPHQLTQLSLQTTATARAEGPAGSCVDPLDSPAFGGDVTLPVALRSVPRIIASLDGPSAGRCAGPRAEDLARMTIPVRRAGRSLDLRVVREATAGPFDVTLRSTLTLQPITRVTGGGYSSSSGSFFGGSGGPGPRMVQELTDIDDRIVPSGSLQATFGAAPTPFCDPLGTCGSTGTIAVRIDAPGRSLELQATEHVRHRLSRSAALRDIGAGRDLVIGEISLPVTVTETLASSGQTTCTDTRRETMTLSLIAPTARTFMLRDDSGNGLRTYCPGPLNADLLPQQGEGALASGPFSFARLTARATTVTLTRGSGFSGPAVAGRWSGGLTLSLQRRSLRVTAQGGRS